MDSAWCKILFKGVGLIWCPFRQIFGIPKIFGVVFGFSGKFSESRKNFGFEPENFRFFRYRELVSLRAKAQFGLGLVFGPKYSRPKTGLQPKSKYPKSETHCIAFRKCASRPDKLFGGLRLFGPKSLNPNSTLRVYLSARIFFRRYPIASNNTRTFWDSRFSCFLGREFLGKKNSRKIFG